MTTGTHFTHVPGASSMVGPPTVESSRIIVVNPRGLRGKRVVPAGSIGIFVSTAACRALVTGVSEPLASSVIKEPAPRASVTVERATSVVSRGGDTSTVVTGCDAIDTMPVVRSCGTLIICTSQTFCSVAPAEDKIGQHLLD